MNTRERPAQCLVIGIDNHVGAYLARLLDARGFGADSNLCGVGDNFLIKKLGVADSVTSLAAADAPAAAAAARLVFLVSDGSSGRADLAEHVIAAAEAATRPPRLVHVADIDDLAGNAVSATLGRLRAARGPMTASVLLKSHDSRLGHAKKLTAKIVAAAFAASQGMSSSKQQRVEITETGPRDWGWTPEYVDAVLRLALRDRMTDAIVSSGQQMTAAEIAEHAFAFFRRAAQDHIVVRGTGSVVPATDPAPLAATTGWRAMTTGRDLVRALCEGAGDRA